MLDQGLANKQIAKQLGIAESTVRTHLERYFRVAKQHNRTGALGFWLRSCKHER
jgi:DNA-binding NarL/FixJ family response regulator